jgi:hypothetical protein
LLAYEIVLARISSRSRRSARHARRARRYDGRRHFEAFRFIGRRFKNASIRFKRRREKHAAIGQHHTVKLRHVRAQAPVRHDARIGERDKATGAIRDSGRRDEKTKEKDADHASKLLSMLR